MDKPKAAPPGAKVTGKLIRHPGVLTIVRKGKSTRDYAKTKEHRSGLIGGRGGVSKRT